MPEVTLLNMSTHPPGQRAWAALLFHLFGAPIQASIIWNSRVFSGKHLEEIHAWSPNVIQNVQSIPLSTTTTLQENWISKAIWQNGKARSHSSWLLAWGGPVFLSYHRKWSYNAQGPLCVWHPASKYRRMLQKLHGISLGTSFQPGNKLQIF